MTSLNKPTIVSYLKVTFTHDPVNFTTEKYTDLPEALPGGFQSVPTMSVDIPENTGTLEKKECKIELPLDTFTTRITNGRPHAPISVLIQEVNLPTDPAVQADQLTVFRGRVMRAKRNPAGKANLVRLICQGPKSRLKVPVGLPVMHHCPFDTYGPGSQLLRVNFRDQRRIDVISGNVVTIDADPANADTWFKNGYMEHNGLTIKIREWDDAVDPLEFTLIEEPPADWLLQFVNIYAGSNKTLEDVRDKLTNEEHFGGIGYKIPAYNPSFEDRPSG